MNWQEFTIDQLKADTPAAIAIGPFGSRMKSDTYVPAGVPVIRGNNITDTIEFTEDFVYISESFADELKSQNVKEGDLVFPHRGSIGSVGIVGTAYPRYVLSSSLMKLTCNPKLVSPLYLFYFFRSPAGQHELLKHASTVGTPGIGTPLASLRSIKVRLPELWKQEQIANTLASLDHKIALHQRMHKTLETMIRTLFRSWFVDFDPVQAKADGQKPQGMDTATVKLFPDSFEMSRIGRVPSGWQVVPIGEHIEAVKGLSYKGEGLAESGMPLHNLNSVYEGGGYKYEGIKFYTGEYKDRHLVRPGDVIVTNTEQGHDLLLIGYPAIVPKFYGESGLFSHHLYRVRPRGSSPLTNHFIYFQLMDRRFRDEVTGHTNGTTVNMLAADGLQRPLFALPPRELIQAFDRFVAPLFQKAEQLHGESLDLKRTRDALLPKLLSGEVHVGSSEGVRHA